MNPARGSSVVAALLLAGLLSPGTGRPVAQAVSPGVAAIAWRRCAGTPGALRNLDLAPGTSAARDTLLLTWDPGGVHWEDFLACYAALYFHDAAGESLGAFWRMGTSRQNKRGLTVSPRPSPDEPGCPSVWQASADGGTQYDFYGTAGKLRFTYATVATQAYPLEGGRRYHVASVVLSRAMIDSLAGADRPVVVELAWLRGYFGTNYHREYARGAERYVTINDPTGEHLRRFLARRWATRPRAWEPAPPKRD